MYPYIALNVSQIRSLNASPGGRREEQSITRCGREIPAPRAEPTLTGHWSANHVQVRPQKCQTKGTEEEESKG